MPYFIRQVRGRKSTSHGNSSAPYPTWDIRSKKDGFGLPSFVLLVTFPEQMDQVARTAPVLATWHIRSRKRSLELSLPPSFLWSNGTQPPIEEGNRSRPPEKTRIFGQQITEEGIQRLQERSAKDLFRHDATSWMDQVHQLDACTYGPVSGCPVIVVVQPTHDRTSDHLLTCLMRGKS